MTQSRLIFDEKDRVAAWVAEQVGQQTLWNGCYAMGLEVDGELTAGFVFENFNGVNAMVHVAITTPHRALFELVEHGRKYAFEHCKLKRLTGLVEETNQKALKFDKHLGFVEEGRLKNAGQHGEDVIVLVLWPENVMRGKRHGR